MFSFQTIPVAPGQPSLSQMELPDSGVAYPIWTQPLTTISTIPSPASPLVHMPLSMSLTTIRQMEAQVVDPQSHLVHLPQQPEGQLDPEPQDQCPNEDLEVEPESPNLLDKLLEDQKRRGEDEDKESYTSSIFLPNV